MTRSLKCTTTTTFAVELTAKERTALENAQRILLGIAELVEDHGTILGSTVTGEIVFVDELQRTAGIIDGFLTTGEEEWTVK